MLKPVSIYLDLLSPLMEFVFIHKGIFLGGSPPLHCTVCGILITQPGNGTLTPAVEAGSLNHWIAMEVLVHTDFKHPFLD